MRTVSVWTVIRSAAQSCATWLARNVRQLGEGGCVGPRRRSCWIERLLTAMPAGTASGLGWARSTATLLPGEPPPLLQAVWAQAYRLAQEASE